MRLKIDLDGLRTFTDKQNRHPVIKLSIRSSNMGKNKQQKRLSVTYSDSSSSLQSELVGKLEDDGAGITYLSLHLPVAQCLVLQEDRNGKRDEI